MRVVAKVFSDRYVAMVYRDRCEAKVYSARFVTNGVQCPDL